MHLKELEIFGFKSFPQKTSLTFGPGITVVVGPNGCGKSNILDAVKWALGEQSPKILRGARMEDVIFNGTESHPALNYAEVALSFSNEDKYFPIEYKEVSVARRLYRSGESQYFINKNLVRLKDIESLFMGTGIGESTYSFVDQGRIEVFLQFKPEEKRLIFDEASGIVKYKERKRETLRRLGETEENLLRLEDIILEVQRQTRYLEKQVAKANKYKDVESELVAAEKKISSLQMDDLESKINKLLEGLTAFREEEKKKNEQAQAVKEEQERLGAQLKSLRVRGEEAHASAVSFSAQVENATVHIGVSKQRIKEAEERNKSIDLTRENLKGRISLLSQRAKEEEEALDNFQDKEKELIGTVAALKDKKDSLSKETEELRREISSGKTAIFGLESQRVNIQNSLVEVQTNLSSFSKRKQRLLLDKGKLDRFLEEGRNRYEQAKRESAQAEDNLNNLKEERKTLSSEERKTSLRKNELRNKLIEKEKELVELRSYQDFLKDLSAKDEIFSAKKKVTITFDEEPKAINKLIVSLKGAEFKREGGLYQASLEAKVIALEEEALEERGGVLHAETGKIKEEIGELEKKQEELLPKITLKDGEIERKSALYQEKLQESESLNREWGRLNEEAELLGRETEGVLREISALAAKQKEIEEETAACEESLRQAEETLAGNQGLVSRNLEAINSLDLEAVKKEEQLQSLRKEKEAFASKVNILEEERVNLARNLEELDAERKGNEARSIALNEEIAKLKVKIEEGKARIEECAQRKKALGEEEAALGRELAAKRESVQGLEKEIEQVRASIYNKKLEIQSFEYEQEKIKDYLKQVYRLKFEKIPREEIVQSLGGRQGEPLELLLESREKLKRKKESLGEVNLVALDEFEELKKRTDFLQNQKSDLVTSKDDLKKAIQKINRTSRDLFLETFVKIEEEFKKNFRFLFGGGGARLVLLDRENVLESGVEIEVQPPGKKLQNVSLLSGGEKALTAISLIFAIFKIRPSPLCVLDEIDAPLDEANVDRFNYLIKDFAKISQFILITHNKKTMSKADCLYGVTMEEKGISKLVSVKFAAQETPS